VDSFIDEKTQLLDIFNKNEIITYTDMNDLSEKINFYNKNDKTRKTIARNGQKKYFKLFNELKTTKYIIDVSFGVKNNLFN